MAAPDSEREALLRQLRNTPEGQIRAALERLSLTLAASQDRLTRDPVTSDERLLKELGTSREQLSKDLQASNERLSSELAAASDHLSNVLVSSLGQSASATRRGAYFIATALLLCGVMAIVAVYLWRPDEVRVVHPTTESIDRLVLNASHGTNPKLHAWTAKREFPPGKPDDPKNPATSVCEPGNFKNSSGEELTAFLQRVYDNREKAIVLIMGGHDNQPLKPALSRKIGSNTQLAHWRAQCIANALGRKVKIAGDRPLADAITLVDTSIGATTLNKDSTARAQDRTPKIIVVAWKSENVAATP